MLCPRCYGRGEALNRNGYMVRCNCASEIAVAKERRAVAFISNLWGDLEARLTVVWLKKDKEVWERFQTFLDLDSSLRASDWPDIFSVLQNIHDTAITCGDVVDALAEEPE